MIKPASQRNLGTQAEVNNGERTTNEEIMAYDMGREAREANMNSNKQELMNFLKNCEEPPDKDDSSEYKRCVKLFRHMKTTVQPSTVSRSIHKITQVILDTGSNGNDMPEKIVSEIGCATIDNPFKHIPINTVLGQYHCNTIVIVPILEEVSTSPNSDFITQERDEAKRRRKCYFMGQINLPRSKRPCFFRIHCRRNTVGTAH